MKKRNVTKENIDSYLNGMAWQASRQLFKISNTFDFDDLKQEAQIIKISATKSYNPKHKKAISLEMFIVFCVKRHFISIAKHQQVILNWRYFESVPESFFPVCTPEEIEYCEHLLTMVTIKEDREVLEEYAAIQNDRIVANTLGVSKQYVNFRRHRAINNIHTQLEKTNV